MDEIMLPYNKGCHYNWDSLMNIVERNLFFKIFHQFANIKTYIGLMLVYTQFQSDFMAYDVMSFHLNIFSDFFAP